MAHRDGEGWEMKNITDHIADAERADRQAMEYESRGDSAYARDCRNDAYSIRAIQENEKQ